MKKNNYKNQLKVINASRGMERRDVCCGQAFL